MTVKLNAANRITLLRIATVPFFIISVIYAPYVDVLGEVAVGFFLFCIITDALDGIVARAWNQKTELGALLDPLADRFLVFSGLVLLIPKGLPVWVAVVVISRDLMIWGGYLLLRFLDKPHAICPTIGGKASTVAQFALVLWGLLCLFVFGEETLFGDRGIIGLAVVVAALSLLSGAQYVKIGLRRLEE